MSSFLPMSPLIELSGASQWPWGSSEAWIFVLREDISVIPGLGSYKTSAPTGLVSCQVGARSENFLVTDYDFDAELAKFICHID